MVEDVEGLQGFELLFLMDLVSAQQSTKDQSQTLPIHFLVAVDLCAKFAKPFQGVSGMSLSLKCALQTDNPRISCLCLSIGSCKYIMKD